MNKETSKLLNLAAAKQTPNANQTVNGKSTPEYKSAYLLNSVVCSNCNLAVAPQGFSWFTDLLLLQAGAKQLHSDAVRSKALLCASPSLIIVWGNILIDAGLMK